MLRCEGCSVMHHPGCWVTNGGCATQTEHRVAPAAMAYSSQDRAPGAAAPHPGDGTRTPSAMPTLEPEQDIPAPIPFRPAHRGAEPAVPEDAPVIGGSGPQPPMIHRTLPSTVGVPAAPRRYQPPPGEQMPRRQMPKIYEGHPLFAYWYVPAAILVAVFVAFSVVWVVGKFTGGDSGQARQETPVATPVGGGGGETPVPSVSVGPTVGGTVTALPSTGPGKFKGGDTVVVSGAAPECLNVRVKAGRENDAIVCVQDGTEFRITGGPETANELTWWRVQLETGEGWAAEDYLIKKP